MRGQGDGDRLVLSGERAEVSLVGGAGDDVYRMAEGADPRWVTEFPRDGRDTLVAAGAFGVPFAVERAVGAGDSRALIEAGEGDQDLIGGPRRDRLDGGPGTDRLVGGAGADRLLLGEWGFDRATGGSGADTFVPHGNAALASAPGVATVSARPSAHLITDLNVARGDRILLSRSSFGPAVTELAKRMVVRQGASPSPRGRRPQLLFSGRDSLLRIDSDGKGELPAQVIAILAAHDRLPARAIRISR